MKKFVLAVDLGGTNLRMASVDSSGEIGFSLKFSTPRGNEPNEIVESIVSAARECLNNTFGSPIAICLAVPGTINSITGIIEKSPNLQALNSFDLATAIETELDLPAVIENDANAAALGENWLGASKGSTDSIMVTLGTGVGGGIIVDGKLVRGADGTAGEIGHVIVEANGHQCGCGGFGCVEQYSSATAVARMAKEFALRNPNVVSFEDNIKDSEAVYDHALQGRKWAQDIFVKQGSYLGMMLAGLVNVLNPEVIVIGGGASAAWEAFAPTMKEQVLRRAYPEPAARAKIVRVALGDNAGLLGAARVGFESAD